MSAARSPSAVSVGRDPRSEVGEIFDAKFHSPIVVGVGKGSDPTDSSRVKQLYPNDSARKKDGWTVVVDPQGVGVWLGFEGSWTIVPWSEVVFIRYSQPLKAVEDK